MKVLWLTNIMLPVYAKAHSLPWSDREGWLTGCCERIMREGSSQIELGIAFPASAEHVWQTGSDPEEIGGVSFYGFNEDLSRPEIYDPSLEKELSDIVRHFSPDVIHCYGSEFPHSLAMARSCGCSGRILVSLQGIAYICAEKFMGGLPESVRKSRTFRDIVKKDDLIRQQQKMAERGEHEKEFFRLISHAAGRTGFDKDACLSINPSLTYHKLGETMRPVFYEKAEGFEPRRHSIFVTQGDVPFKGFHVMLMALHGILDRYPDAHLYVAGNSVTGRTDRSEVTIPDEQEQKTSSGRRVPLFLRIGAYGRYLRSLIARYNLEDHISVLGSLSAAQIKEQLLRSETFVCPSFIENSPNSLAEAMLLARPCVASDVGGIRDMAEDVKEALFFPEGDHKALADRIIRLWEDPEKAQALGARARERALIQHDPDANYERLLEIYRSIGGMS